MVQLVEVEDEHFQQPQVGPEEDDEDFTDTGANPPSPSSQPFSSF
jgi:import receptor subunit TOM22